MGWQSNRTLKIFNVMCTIVSVANLISGGSIKYLSNKHRFLKFGVPVSSNDYTIYRICTSQSEFKVICQWKMKFFTTNHDIQISAQMIVLFLDQVQLQISVDSNGK